MNPLSCSQLYRACDPQALSFSTTEELEPLDQAIGQQRAIDAIQFGVDMTHEGYNLYIMGESGFGRHTLARQAIEARARQSPPPPDLCYIADFDHPAAPLALVLPTGKGRSLRQRMQQLISELLQSIPATFRSEAYQQEAKTITDQARHQREKIAEELSERAKEKGIALLRTAKGFNLAAEKAGKILSGEEFGQLNEEERHTYEHAMEEIREQIDMAFEQLPEWQRETQQALLLLDRRFAERTIALTVAEIESTFGELPDVLEYLTAVKHDLLQNLALFRSDNSEEEPADPDSAVFNRYRINLLVDNAGANGSPVIFEDNPTYHNLTGRIEHLARMGTLTTDFTLIKPGALHRANGGYLILDIEKVLANPYAWDALKRALRSGEIRIESLEKQLSLVSTISLEPQPFPFELKVMLIGDRQTYFLLKEYDSEFDLLFKVTADFAEEMERGDSGEGLFARLIATLVFQEKLRHLDSEAVALVIEENARKSWDGERLSLHLEGLIDLLRESDYRATKEISHLIRRSHVEGAIHAREYRSDQWREQVQSQILRGTVKIDTKGVQLAQVNGLTVIQVGDHAFGAPTRISATARLGGGEVVDISRESNQGGPIHSKGVMILASYLAERYAKHQPLSLSASLVFEQTYGVVEGDSASAAELCALLSALGDIPIHQSMAITGSINQRGEIQAIGGVCQKIEGFFAICAARGLDGSHGVIIPESNVKDLMLRPPVVEAARQGLFSIYAVHHAEQAMELLTGLDAGRHNAEGIYPEASINGRIQLRLAEWIGLRQYFAGALQAEIEEAANDEEPATPTTG